MGKITIIIIAAVALILGAWDIYVLIKGGTEATISHLVLVSSYKYPIIPFLGGFLSSHFWWRIKDTEETKKIADFISGKEKDK